MPSSSAQPEMEQPLVKRRKLSPTRAPPRKQESRIFTPFRTIGLISSTPVPFTSLPLGKTTFQITTCVGRCLQTYNLKRGLNLVFLTRPQTPFDITATLAYKDRVFAAWGSGTEGAQGIWVFKRGKKLAELELPVDLKEPVKQLLVFGVWVVACCSTRIEVWKIGKNEKETTYEHYTTLYSTAASKQGNELSGGICKMPTYLNKIFAGRRDGSIEIWNVSSGKLVFTILPPGAGCGSVTAMEPTPALSLLGIAYSEGPLVVHDIRADKTVIHLQTESSVTSISFRTDELGAGEDGRKSGVMATAGPDNGDITFWDLNGGGRVMGILRGAHNPPSDAGATVGGGVSRVQFLPGQPVIVTSGLDNALKSWIFDETPYSPVPRILHSRSGHAAPVTKLLFLPSDADGADAGGKWLLSAGKDRSLWGWSLRRDGQSTELSQGNIRKKAKKLGILGSALANEPSSTLEDLKAPEITCLAMSLNRDGGMGANAGSGAIWQKGNGGNKKATDATASGVTGWESVVTGHRQDKFARTWFWGRKKAGRWAFETGDGGYVSSVAMSPCGTFAVVGSETGGIDMFNLQSGLHRQRYPSKLTPAQARKLKIQKLQEAEGIVATKKFPHGLGKHRMAVTGLVVDGLNKNVISCSLDGKIKFWEFLTGNLTDEISWHDVTSITAMRYHAANEVIALTCSDLSIRLIDILTKKSIRKFFGCQNGINDFCFSNDGRWIIAASKDSIVRIWDLPTGHLIDAIRTPSPCTALAFSNTGEFLATACEGEVGVNIWNNKTLFTHVPTRPITESEIAEMAHPTVSGEGGHGVLDGAFEDDVSDTADSAPVISPEQLSEDLYTLSLVPKSQWLNLLHLEAVKARNKPKEAPKKPEKAPFFLPSLEKPLPIAASLAEKKEVENAAERSRIMKMDRMNSEGIFTVSLRNGAESGDYTHFITHLSTLPPAQADVEIRSLSPPHELTNFVQALTQRLKAKKSYQLILTWMHVFLSIHAEEVSRSQELRSALLQYKEVRESGGENMEFLVGYCSGVLGWIRGE